jgi:hypothetical protein
VAAVSGAAELTASRSPPPRPRPAATSASNANGNATKTDGATARTALAMDEGIGRPVCSTSVAPAPNTASRLVLNARPLFSVARHSTTSPPVSPLACRHDAPALHAAVSVKPRHRGMPVEPLVNRPNPMPASRGLRGEGASAAHRSPGHGVGAGASGRHVAPSPASTAPAPVAAAILVHSCPVQVRSAISGTQPATTAANTATTSSGPLPGTSSSGGRGASERNQLAPCSTAATRPA